MKIFLLLAFLEILIVKNFLFLEIFFNVFFNQLFQLISYPILIEHINQGMNIFLSSP